MFSYCCGFGRKKDSDTEPLLPKYEDDTVLQQRLHQKLHTYQMIRALTKGFMPSTEQAIINLRTLLASDILNPNNKDLSDAGVQLVRNCRNWLKVFIELLRRKNDKDQIQDFIWYLSKSRISLDTADLSNQAGKIQAKANAQATYDSVRTVGSLLLTNSDFRLFLGDLSIVGRQILSDTAFSVSNAAEQTAQSLEPSDQEQKKLTGPDADKNGVAEEGDQENEPDTSKVLADGATAVAKDTVASAKENLKGDTTDTLAYRLKQAVLSLRKKPDYNESVSIIAKLIQRYAKAYSRAAEATLETAADDIETNPALDRALRNLWDLISSFGEKQEWEKLEQDFNKVMEHTKSDPQFEQFMTEIGNTLQGLLTDPDFFDNINKSIDELRAKASELSKESGFQDDLGRFLGQVQAAMQTLFQDKDINQMFTATKRLYDTLSPPGALTNPDLVSDSINIFLPLLIRTIQYVPIPRLEVSVPEVDLLLENLILEPGKTVNSTSFLPYRLFVSTKNDLEIRKAHSKKVTSKVKSLMTISINGVSVAAQDVGFWIRGHAGLFRFADEGIASVFLDERGFDIALDVEIGREKLEQILTLRGVRVHIHKLDYTLRKSKLSWLGWLFKPLIKQLVRRSLEKTLAENIANFLHDANRELVYARERLRATRIADPKDVMTFFKAVLARLTPEDDPDVYTRIGMDAPNRGVFKNVYAPGSIVKVWHEEALQAEQNIEEAEEFGGGWRNEIFEVNVTNV